MACCPLTVTFIMVTAGMGRHYADCFKLRHDAEEDVILHRPDQGGCTASIPRKVRKDGRGARNHALLALDLHQGRDRPEARR
jgi:hypothetical protein